jgi:hypothetical protein
MVGLALAILVKKEGANGAISDQDADRILVLVGGIAALTLVVNATTCPALTEKLEITAAPEGRNVLIRNVDKQARAHVHAIMWKDMADFSSSKTYLPGVVRDLMDDLTANVKHHLPGDHDHGDDHGDGHGDDHSAVKVVPEPDEEEKHVGRSKKESMFLNFFKEDLDAPDPDELFFNFQKWKERMLAAAGKHNRIARFRFGAQLKEITKLIKEEPIDPKQLKIVREVFLEAVRANYWEQLERGRFVVGSEEPQMLLNSVNLAKESCGSRLADWSMLQQDIHFSLSTEKIKVDSKRVSLDSEGRSPRKPERSDKRKSSFAGMKRAATTTLTDSMLSTDSTGKFSLASWQKWAKEKRVERNLKDQTTAIQIISAFIEAHETAQGQIAAYFGDDADVDSPEEAFVIVESQIEVFKASAMAGSIDKNVHLKVNTMWKASHLAEEYRKYVLSVMESGVLSNKEAEVLLHPIADTLRGWDKKRRQLFRDLGRRNGNDPMNELEAVLLMQRVWKKMKAKAGIQGEKGYNYGEDNDDHGDKVSKEPIPAEFSETEHNQILKVAEDARIISNAASTNASISDVKENSVLLQKVDEMSKKLDRIEDLFGERSKASEGTVDPQSKAEVLGKPAESASAEEKSKVDEEPKVLGKPAESASAEEKLKADEDPKKERNASTESAPGDSFPQKKTSLTSLPGQMPLTNPEPVAKSPSKPVAKTEVAPAKLQSTTDIVPAKSKQQQADAEFQEILEGEDTLLA